MKDFPGIFWKSCKRLLRKFNFDKIRSILNYRKIAVMRIYLLDRRCICFMVQFLQKCEPGASHLFQGGKHIFLESQK